jgi:hypothetical protein
MIINIRQRHTSQKNKGCNKNIYSLDVGALLFVIGIVAIAVSISAVQSSRIC